jgi:probable phosphoglycerate mutase
MRLMTAALLLVRHGRTAWHDGNRYAGSSDIPLDDEGERQADALGEWAKSAALTHLVASPLRRTVATANAVERSTGLAAELVPELRELDFGIAEGQTLAEMMTSAPAAAAAFLADPVAGHWPEGDDPATRTAGASAALFDIAEKHSGGRVLVVMHSTMIRLVVCDLLSIPLPRYRDLLGPPEPTYVTTLSIADGCAALGQYNSAPHRSESV